MNISKKTSLIDSVDYFEVYRTSLPLILFLM